MADLRVREAGDAQSRTIEGYALKFSERSQLLCDWWERYYEVLEPGCINEDTLGRCDIVLTMFHNRQLVLGRSRNGEGTLHYSVDEVGLKFWCDMPRTADGDKALELIGRGDIAGCSFIYSTDESKDGGAVSYEIIKDDSGEDVMLRRVHRIENVYDFTITTSPAYEQTEVTRREVEKFGILPREEKPEDEKQDGEEPTEDTEETATEETEGESEKHKVDEDKKREFLREFRKRISRIV